LLPYLCFAMAASGSRTAQVADQPSSHFAETRSRSRDPSLTLNPYHVEARRRAREEERLARANLEERLAEAHLRQFDIEGSLVPSSSSWASLAQTLLLCRLQKSKRKGLRTALAKTALILKQKSRRFRRKISIHTLNSSSKSAHW
jgi:hypothetical protein